MTPISLSRVMEAPGSTGLGAGLRRAIAYSGPPSASLRAALSPPQPIPKTAKAETNRAADFADFMNTLGRLVELTLRASFRQFSSAEVPKNFGSQNLCQRSDVKL